MNVNKGNYPVIIALLMLMNTSFAFAQKAQKPKYAADVPEFLLTPDKVETEQSKIRCYVPEFLLTIIFRRPRIFRWYAQ